MNSSPKLLTKREAAERTRLNPATLMRLCRRGAGPRMIVLGRRVYFQEQHIKDWLDKNTSPSA